MDSFAWSLDVILYVYIGNPLYKAVSIFLSTLIHCIHIDVGLGICLEGTTVCKYLTILFF
jgi:hypothetical protein